MAKRKRNYAREYARRLERAQQLGYSRAVARGHPRKTKGEIGLRRAHRMGLRPGATIERKGRHGTIANPFRPTYAAIRKRARALGLPYIENVLRGKKGLIPIAWAGPPHNRYLKDDETRDAFIEFYTQPGGLETQEAYTLWFSP